MSLIHVVTSILEHSFEDDKSVFVGEGGINAPENKLRALTIVMMRRRLPFITVVVQLISDLKASVTIHLHGTSDEAVQLEM